MEEEMKNKNQKLNDYIRNSRIHSFRNSMAQSKMSMKSGLLGSSMSGIFDFPESKLVVSMVKKKSAKNEPAETQQKEEQKEIQPLRVSSQIVPKAENRFTTLSKMKKVDIAAEQLPQIEE